VPDSKIALSADGRLVAIAGVDLSDQPKFVLCVADLADGSIAGVECLAMPSVDALRGGVVYYRARTGDQDGRADLASAPAVRPSGRTLLAHAVRGWPPSGST
jgi:hypothetical protein